MAKLPRVMRLNLYKPSTTTPRILALVRLRELKERDLGETPLTPEGSSDGNVPPPLFDERELESRSWRILASVQFVPTDDHACRSAPKTF